MSMSLPVRRIACWCLTLLLGAGPADAARRALIIGVDDYRDLDTVSTTRRLMTDLRGAVNDARGIEEALREYYGFGDADILALTNRQATRKAILAAIQAWLIDGTEKGDLVVLYFSGHGARVPDFDFDERDGCDEAWVPHDAVLTATSVADSRVILDDEVGTLLAQAEDRTVVVIVDACYSGTSTRSIGRRRVAALKETPARGPAKYVGLERLPQRCGLSDDAGSGEPSWTQSSHEIVLTSSSAGQISRERVRPDGEFVGVFTSALLEAMSRTPAPTYFDLYRVARAIVRDDFGESQEPQLQLPGAASRYVTAFSPSEAVRPPSTDRTPPNLVRERLLLRVEDLSADDGAHTRRLREELAVLPYVELTTGPYFDRLVRGSVDRRGSYLLRLLTRSGDAVPFEPIASAREATAQMGSRLEYAYLTKRLNRLWVPAPSFRVDLAAAGDRRDFYLGESLVFEVAADRDCYILLYNVDSSGNANLVFPNQYEDDNFLPAGHRVTLPTEAMRREQFEFRFFPPAGEEAFTLVATSSPLDLARLRDGRALNSPAPGDALNSTSPSRALTQALLETVAGAVAPGFRWGEDTVVLRSHRR